MYNTVNTGNRITSVRLPPNTPPLRSLSVLMAMSVATVLHWREVPAFARFPVNIHENS